MRQSPLLVATLLATACASAAAPLAPVLTAGPGLTARALYLGGVEYDYALFVPSTYNPRVAMPTLLLVHGAGGSGPDFIRNWTAFAESHGIILIAPTLDLSAAAEPSVPTVFPALVNDVAKEWAVDSTRRYLFGYSGGGYFVYDAALLRSDFFAGAGIFASVIQPGYESIVQRAPRHTDIAIYIGDSDPFFTLDQARQTRDLILSGGNEVRYVELPNQGHNYLLVADTINPDLWTFLSAHTLSH